MKKKSIFRPGIWAVAIAIFLAGCAGMMSRPTEKNFKDPVITLKHVEVHKYWGWWYFSAKVNPSKGKAGNYGAPLALAFIFKIKNPNEFAVMMEEMKFTVGFDEFDLDTVILQESVWVPAKKTIELRAISVFDGLSLIHISEPTRKRMVALACPGNLLDRNSGLFFSGSCKTGVCRLQRRQNCERGPFQRNL